MSDTTQYNPHAHETIDFAHWERIAAMFAPCVPTGKPTGGPCYANWDAAMPGLDKLPTVDHKAAAERRKAGYRPMRDDPLKRGGGLLPYPVYVARYADGSTSRLSFWSAAKKPINFARGYNVSLLIHESAPVAGHVEWNGQRFDDPHFSPDAVAPVLGKRKATTRDYQRKLADIAAMIAAGNVEAALAACAE